MFRIILHNTDGDHLFSIHNTIEEAHKVLSKMVEPEFLSRAREGIVEPGLSPALRYARINWVNWLDEAIQLGVGNGIILYEDV